MTTRRELEAMMKLLMKKAKAKVVKLRNLEILLYKVNFYPEMVR